VTPLPFFIPFSLASIGTISNTLAFLGRVFLVHYCRKSVSFSSGNALKSLSPLPLPDRPLALWETDPPYCHQRSGPFCFFELKFGIRPFSNAVLSSPVRLFNLPQRRDFFPLSPLARKILTADLTRCRALPRSSPRAPFCPFFSFILFPNFSLFAAVDVVQLTSADIANLKRNTCFPYRQSNWRSFSPRSAPSPLLGILFSETACFRTPASKIPLSFCQMMFDGSRQVVRFAFSPSFLKANFHRTTAPPIFSRGSLLLPKRESPASFCVDLLVAEKNRFFFSFFLFFLDFSSRFFLSSTRFFTRSPKSPFCSL